MTEQLQTVVEMRAEGHKWQDIADKTGFGNSHLRTMFQTNTDGIKDRIEEKKAEIRAQVSVVHKITRDKLMSEFLDIAENTKETEPKTAIKAFENVGRIIGAYHEDNSQKGLSSLGAAMARLVATERRRLPKAVESEVIDVQGQEEAEGSEQSSVTTSPGQS